MHKLHTAAIHGAPPSPEGARSSSAQWHHVSKEEKGQGTTETQHLHVSAEASTAISGALQASQPAAATNLQDSSMEVQVTGTSSSASPLALWSLAAQPK